MNYGFNEFVFLKKNYFHIIFIFFSRRMMRGVDFIFVGVFFGGVWGRIDFFMLMSFFTKWGCRMGGMGGGG